MVLPVISLSVESCCNSISVFLGIARYCINLFNADLILPNTLLDKIFSCTSSSFLQSDKSIIFLAKRYIIVEDILPVVVLFQLLVTDNCLVLFPISHRRYLLNVWQTFS